MLWNNHFKDIPKGSHAFLSPSTYSWCNYDDEKLLKAYASRAAIAQGTEMHELAERLIKLKVKLPEDPITFNMYVNDCIDDEMEPEKQLYYSKYCFGTADAIKAGIKELRIYDLKTGKNKASFMQLKVYAALFFLEYPGYIPGNTDVELRIYQHDEVRIEKPETDDIVPIMDKIVRFSNVLVNMEENYGHI